MPKRSLRLVDLTTRWKTGSIDTLKKDLPSGLIVPAGDLPAKPVDIDLGNAEELRNAMKGQMPEGMDFEIEEINNEDHEKIMKQNQDATGKSEAGEKENVPPPETVLRDEL
ncbi:hypothetical protein LTR08_005441 [Meristemomyces frigidus]|nr:hypothetical protein LTR08_005441 [Meristemomyces frigidus]